MRLHHRVPSVEKFDVTSNCFCGQLIRMLVNSMWESPDVRATGNGAQRCGKILSSFPQKYPFPWGDLVPQLIHSSLSTPEFTCQNQMASCSVQPFFAGLMVITDRLTDHATPYVAMGCIWLVLWCGQIIQYTCLPTHSILCVSILCLACEFFKLQFVVLDKFDIL